VGLPRLKQLGDGGGGRFPSNLCGIGSGEGFHISNNFLPMRESFRDGSFGFSVLGFLQRRNARQCGCYPRSQGNNVADDSRFDEFLGEAIELLLDILGGCSGFYALFCKEKTPGLSRSVNFLWK